MAEYTYEILGMNAQTRQGDLEKPIHSVFWRAVLREDNIGIDHHFQTFLDPADTNNFIPSDDLDIDTVWQWIWAKEDKDKVHAQLQQRLIDFRDPNRIVTFPLPWADTNPYTDTLALYVLEHRGEAKTQPLHWNSNKFNEQCKILGVSADLPPPPTVYQRRLVPLDRPLEIDENTRIHRVVLSNEPPPTMFLDQQLPTNLFYESDYIEWDFSSHPAQGRYVLKHRPIAEIQRNLKFLVREQAESKMLAGHQVTLDGKTYLANISYLMQSLLSATIATMGENDIQSWPMQNLTYARLDRAGMIELHRQVRDRVSQIQAEELELLEVIGTINDANALQELASQRIGN